MSVACWLGPSFSFYLFKFSYCFQSKILKNNNYVMPVCYRIYFNVSLFTSAFKLLFLVYYWCLTEDYHDSSSDLFGLISSPCFGSCFQPHHNPSVHSNFSWFYFFEHISSLFLRRSFFLRTFEKLHLFFLT